MTPRTGSACLYTRSCTARSLAALARKAPLSIAASAFSTGVVLSEAVELAGRYGTDDSSRFVNGVLASAAAELRP